MQVNLDNDLSSHGIRAYQPGEITITLPTQGDSNTAGPVETEMMTGSFVISPRHLIRDWPPINIEALLEQHLKILIELQPEVVLLGTGQNLRFPETGILAQLHNQQIGVEVMDTAAACRTYNILMTEGRFVVAGMINPG
ncbi:MAG: Mth938-like domain-containing protein [Chloroflexi bacterium]|nr:Mth938-like domain-containing protein [Chloroflexota bacterium]